MMRISLVFFFLISACGLSAQRISNTAVYRNINSPKYFRLHYENDYFSTSDLYYTQGINFEYVNRLSRRATHLPAYHILKS
jgi:lipid A 3-O-deacylase